MNPNTTHTHTATQILYTYITHKTYTDYIEITTTTTRTTETTSIQWQHEGKREEERETNDVF